jgi:hypothetical protein
MHDPHGDAVLSDVPLLISRNNRLSPFSGYKVSSTHKKKKRYATPAGIGMPHFMPSIDKIVILMD